MLKIHAFVRESAPKVLSYKKLQGLKDNSDPPTEADQADEGTDDATNSDKTVKENQPLPEFGQYLYFLFCPTLIYRDQYPMTPYIRWNYVVSNSLQTLACIFYTYYVFARFCVPVFRSVGKGQWSFKHFTLSVFSCMLPGTMVLVLGFFAILHSWLNAFAEMTRFADRMFYKDWWNSNSYADYYRSWNVVVHDWLYTYIYKDMVKILKNRQVATVTVFLLSAIVHEYVLMFAFRFFYPMLLFVFGVFGLSFVFLKPKKHGNVSQVWNVFMWITLIVGNGLLMCLYSQEWFATQICPRNSNSLLDQLSPRSWNLKCVQARGNSA